MSTLVRDEPPSKQNDKTGRYEFDPSCFDLRSPLFVTSESLTHLEVSTPATNEMANSQGQIPKVQRESDVMEQRRADSDSTNGSKNESSVPKSFPSSELTTPMPFVAPDGGYKAWSAVAGGFLCQFASFGFLNVCVFLLLIFRYGVDVAHAY